MREGGPPVREIPTAPVAEKKLGEVDGGEYNTTRLHAYDETKMSV